MYVRKTFTNKGKYLYREIPVQVNPYVLENSNFGHRAKYKVPDAAKHVVALLDLGNGGEWWVVHSLRFERTTEEGLRGRS